MFAVYAVVLALLLAPTALAGSAPAQHWTQQPGEILAPSQSWEGSALQEPTVLHVKGKWQMWYTSGRGDKCSLGYATSSDGIAWTKYAGNPIAGGEDHQWVCHNSVTYFNGWYFLYYSRLGENGGFSDPGIFVMASRDGIHFGATTQVLKATSSAFGTANSAVWKDGPHDWKMLYDAVPENGGLWQMHLASAKGPLGPFVETSNGSLMDLNVAPSEAGGVFGAPTIRKVAGVYQLWYLASTATDWVLPTDVYYSESTNLRDWSVPELVVGREQDWQVDQIADPSVVTVNGETRMYFAGLDNVTHRPDVLGGIGMAVLG